MPADTTREVELIQAMAAAPSPEVQEILASRLAGLRLSRAADERDRRSLDLAAAALPPAPPQYGGGVLPGVRTTAASDWLAHVQPTRYDPTDVAQRMVAAASLWYDRLPPAVRADRQEFAAQADGMARREASAWGEQAPEACRAFLDQASHLGGLVLADATSQTPPGSGLPVGTDDEQTFDDSLWGPAGAPDSQTQQGETPSLAEGGPIDGDVAESIQNPAADQPHDAGPGPGTQPSIDYLDGTPTPPAAGTGMTTLNSLYPALGSLISRRAQQVVADMALTPPSGVAPMPSTHDDSLTPSQQMGPPPAAPVPATGALPVELAPHDAGPGNGPAADGLDGQVFPWPGQAARRPLSALAAQIRREVGDRVPVPARVFLDALAMMRSGDEPFGSVSGHAVVSSFLDHAAPHLGEALVAELSAHLAPRVAGDLPPWLKKKDGGDSDDKKDDSDKDDDSDDKDDDDDKGSKDDSDSSDCDDDSDDDDDDDDSMPKKVSALVMAAAGDQYEFRPPRGVHASTWYPTDKLQFTAGPSYRSEGAFQAGNPRYYTHGYYDGLNGNAKVHYQPRPSVNIKSRKFHSFNLKRADYHEGYEHGSADRAATGTGWPMTAQTAAFRARVQASLQEQAR